MKIDVFDVTIMVATLLLGWRILTWYGVFGGNKASKKAVEDKRTLQKIQRSRRRVSWLMMQFESFAMKVGGGISTSVSDKYSYYITRREMMVKTLGRQWKPIELVGLFRMLGFMGVLIATVGISRFSFNPLWFFLLLLFVPKLWEFSCERKLVEEDAELEQDFPDLYLLLNPKLQLGANARIANVLSEYLMSLDHAYAPTEHLAIKKFVKLLRNNIELLSDEVLALQYVRRMYKSAVVINFCNIAIQAMNGIDNKEKLIAFEQELTRQKMDMMRMRARKLVEKGEKAVLAVYIILAEFVLLSFWSRLGGSLDMLFNLM